MYSCSILVVSWLFSRSSEEVFVVPSWSVYAQLKVKGKVAAMFIRLIVSAICALAQLPVAQSFIGSTISARGNCFAHIGILGQGFGGRGDSAAEQAAVAQDTTAAMMSTDIIRKSRRSGSVQNLWRSQIRRHMVALAAETLDGSSSSSSVTNNDETEPEHYVQCGKCKSVYAINMEELGSGKKVSCSVCGHTWWQTADRAQILRNGWMMVDMNEERLATIHENIAAGRAPNEEKAKVKGAVTVFIGNLPFNYGDDEIEAIFEPFGKVASVTLVKQADGRSKGYAFVDMVEKEAGEKAIADLNGSEIDGRNLNVALGGDSK